MSSPSGFTTVLGQVDHPAQATAATLETFIVGEAQHDATVSEASLIPSGALGVDNTNNRTFTLQNRGQQGTSSVVIATLTTNAAGGAWSVADEKQMTLTATMADRNVAAGDVFAVVESIAGAGSVHPAIQVTVKGTRR